MSPFNYSRRATVEVKIGSIPLGGDNPVRLQSMTNTSTMDTVGSVEQAMRIVAAGGEYVRLTAQGVREAENLRAIHSGLRARGCEAPLVADIHFNPMAAFVAAEHVEKVRINPGNFVDPGRVFRKIEYTDQQYQAETQRIEKALVPFLETCKAHGTAIRIGVNHGSLSDRIMSRYGDTPAGMVESAMEFLRVCVKHDFMDVVVSIKASNTVIMVETVRRLVKAMDDEGMKFPLHLGVTEAGDGEDGRIKSAVGIGTLLAEGIGDTIRVSLSEAPENEIPVARSLVDYITSREGHPHIEGEYYPGYNPVAPTRRHSKAVNGIGGDNPVAVIALSADDFHPDSHPDFLLSDLNPDEVVILTSTHQNPLGHIQSQIHRLTGGGCDSPIVVKLSYNQLPKEEVTLRAAADFGALLLNGLVDGIMIDSDSLSPREESALAFNILQASRQRFTRTEFIACPGCGRTLFELQSTLAEVKAATSHLKGLKIGIMGCIVNGPGEMADADFGYVGAGVGNVSLYKGKECVTKNIPASEALPALIQLIKDSGQWIDPPTIKQ